MRETELESGGKALSAWLWRLAKAGVTALCLFVVFRKVDMAAVAGQAGAMLSGWFLLAVAVWLVSLLLGGIRWALLARPHGLGRALGPYVRYTLVGSFFNTVLPTFVGGDVVRAYYLSRRSGQISRPSTTVLMDRNVGTGGLFLVGLMAAWWYHVEREAPGLIAAVVTMMAIYVLGNVVILYPPALRRFERLLLWALPERLRQKVRNVVGALGIYSEHLPTTVLMVLFSVPAHLVSFVAVYFVGLSLGIPVELHWYLVYVPVIALVTLIPVSIGGLGLREGAFLSLFSTLGVPPEQSVALSLLWYVMMIVAGLPGLALYLTEK
jgi:uncharacterized protein (TIRG00374 family)